MAAILFDGVSDYAIEASPDPKFRLSTFTIECWFRLGEFGKAMTSSTPKYYPLVARGDNYNLAVDEDTLRLAARFTDTGAVLRRLAGQRRTLDRGVWYHAALTYGAGVARLWLNGLIEDAIMAGTPQTSGTEPVCVGAVYTTSAAGAFHGEIRNVRIWDRALTGAQLRARAETSPSMLIASGCVDELQLTELKIANDGTPPVLDASLPGYTSLPAEWHIAQSGLTLPHSGRIAVSDDDAPFKCDEPGIPSLASPADLATPAGPNVNLSAAVTDRDGTANTIEFWGRAWKSHPAFTIVTLPDTQVPVSQGEAAVLDGFQWFVDEQVSRNIRAVLSLGDCVDAPSSTTEWTRYSNGVALIEAASIPYLWCVGNHDREAIGVSTVGNTYFGSARFAGRPYYLGHFGSSNNNSAIRFQVASDPTPYYCTAISLEYDALSIPGVIDWAYGIAATYPNDLVIVVSHYLLAHTQPGIKSALCEALHTAFTDLPNARLFLSGHFAQAHRRDTLGGTQRFTIMADYQFGSTRFFGRLLTFDPRAGTMKSTTRDTTQDLWRVETESEFTLPVELPGYPSFAKIGEVTGVAPGGTANLPWNGLTTGQHYEWFARARNGIVYRDSARRGFTVT